ncbi:MAG: transporter [Planctomycetes bacterium]|nr:transporter [Planctomycetota bacterium]
MSLFGKLVRSAAAALAVTASTASAQDAAPAVLDLPGLNNPDAVTPAAGFGPRFGPRVAPGCAPSHNAPCIPVTPCPVTGEPMTPNPQQPVAQQPGVPDFGNRGGGAGLGPQVGLDGGYIEPAIPRSMVRVRFDSAYGSNRPDRGNFFYAKCGCFFPQRDALGPPRPERNVDYQELMATGEVAVSERASAFFDLPIRFINPTANDNFTGLGDIGFGGKYAIIYSANRVVSLFGRFQAPAGTIAKGLGNGNWWFEPGVLYQEQLSQKWSAFGEFRFMMPLGTRTDFTGNLLRYGIGSSYVVAQGEWGYIAPVVELVGWTVLSGQTLNPDIGQAVRASGDTIVNAKFGLRIGLGAPKCGSPALSRSDIYVGYGRALTGEVWYKDMFRLEYRRNF